MRYCIAKLDNSTLPYIRMSEDLYYTWGRTIEEALKSPLKNKDDYDYNSLDDWIVYLDSHGMEVIFDYDEQSNPEYFL